MRIRRSVEIKAAAARIWPLLVEPREILQWCHTIRTIRHTGDQRTGVGTPFYFEEKAGGRWLKVHVVVTEWIENERAAFKMTAGDFVKGYEQRYTIAVTPSGSLVTISESVVLPYGILGQIAGLFRRSRSESHLERMLVRIKAMAEY